MKSLFAPFLAVGLSLSILGGQSAWAGNGLLLTGYGARSATMSGADIAIANDVYSLAGNPAGLANIIQRDWSLHLIPYYSGVNHTDHIGNEEEYAQPRASMVGGGGYARRLEDIDAVVGINLIALGGIGYVFEGFTTPFGGKDEISAQFGIFKISPGIAWTARPGLRVGAALGFTYATAEQKLFPETSVSGEAEFSGLNLAGLSAFGVNYRLGLQYDAHERVTLALTYSSPTRLEMKGGNLIVNYTAQGFGKVRYNEAGITGLELPHEVGAGLSWRVNDKFTLVTELLWLNWADSVDQLTVTAKHPQDAVPARQLTIATPLEFRNQTVHSIAGVWQVNETLELRAGYAYGKNPHPSRNLSPVFAQIPEQNLSFGFGMDLANSWRLEAGMEIQLKETVDYNSPVFGNRASETNECHYLHIQIGKRW